MLIALRTARDPSQVLSRDQPVAGQAALEPPAVSPTEWIGETRPRDGRVVATEGGPEGRALWEQASTKDEPKRGIGRLVSGRGGITWQPKAAGS